MSARAFLITSFIALLSVVASADDEAKLCGQGSVPAAVTSRLKAEFPAWRVQTVGDLAPMTKKRWQEEKPLSCPGTAEGQFELVGQISYAFLLVPTANPDREYKFLVFTPSGNQSAFLLRTVEDWNKGNVSHYFIHKVDIAKVFSSAWVGKLHVKTKQGILFADAAESEYGVEVYFFADGKYQHEPIDY